MLAACSCLEDRLLVASTLLVVARPAAARVAHRAARVAACAACVAASDAGRAMPAALSPGRALCGDLPY
eukprot:330010-Prymnesium_polylepis.1